MANPPVIFPVDFGTDQVFKRIEQIASRAEKRFAKIQFMSNPKNGFDIADAQLRSFNKTLDRTNDRVIALAASTSIIYGTIDAFKALASQSLKVEQSLKNINVNLNASTSELKNLSASLFDIANQTGQSFYDAAKAAEEFGRQGLGLAKTLKATKAALTLTQITGLDVVNSVESLTSAVNSFQKEGLSYEEVVNRMAAADTSFAVSSKDIAEGIKRVGSTAVDANVSFNELVATLTTLKQVTGRSGGVSGNALKTIYTRLSRSDVQDTIESVGVATKNSNGSFISASVVLKNLSEKYKDLTDAQKASVAEATGGVYQINQVKALLQNLADTTGVYENALYRVANAQNEAYAKSAALIDTPLKKINSFKNEVIELSAAIGNLGVNEGIGNIAGTFASLFSDISEILNKDFDSSSLGEKFVQGFANGVVKAATGPGLAILAKAFSGLVGKTTGTLFKDFKSQLYDQGKLKTQSGAAENIVRADAVSKAASREIGILNTILSQNDALRDQILLRSKTSLESYVKSSATKIPPRRTFAGGYNPLASEMSQINQGVGGASKSAKPVFANIKTSPNKSEKVVLNTDEYVIKNYMGSGADAVFNKEMLSAAGGLGAIQGLGNVTKVFASGMLPNRRGGNLQPINKSSAKVLNSLEMGSSIFWNFKNKTLPKYLQRDVRFSAPKEADIRRILNGEELPPEAGSFSFGGEDKKSLMRYFPARHAGFGRDTVIHEAVHAILSGDGIGNFNSSENKGFTFNKDQIAKRKRIFEVASKSAKKNGLGIQDEDFYRNYAKKYFGGKEGKNFLLEESITHAVPDVLYGKEDRKNLLHRYLARYKNNFASGFEPSGIKFKKESNGFGKGRFLSHDSGSLEYAKRDGFLELDYMEVKKKGKGIGGKLFKRLTQLSKRSGLPIKSATLLPQHKKDKEIKKILKNKKDNFDVFKSFFPQLGFRDKDGIDTSLDFSFGGSTKRFQSFGKFKGFINSLPANMVSNMAQNGDMKKVFIDNLVTKSFAGGFIPNLARGSNPLQDVSNTMLYKSVKNSSSARIRDDSRKELERRGVFNDPSSVAKYGIDPSDLSDKGIKEFYKNNIVNGKDVSSYEAKIVKNQLRQRGTLRDPNSIKKGYKISDLTNSAVKSISSNPAIYGANMQKGAQKEYEKRKNELSLRLQNRQTKQSINQKAREELSRQAEYDSYLESQRNSNIAIRDSADQEASFNEFIGANPYAKEKDIAKAYKKSYGKAPSKEELKKFSKQTRGNRNSRLAARFDSVALASSFAGGAIQPFVSGNKTAEGGLNVLQSAATGLSLGSSFGPVGIALGTLAGAAVGLAGEWKKSKSNFEDLAKSANKLTAAYEASASKVSSYFEDSTRVNDLLQDPNSTPDQIKNASSKLAASLFNLPTDVSANMKGLSEKDQNKVANEFLRKQESDAAVANSAANVAKIVESSSSFISMFRDLGNSKNSIQFDNKEQKELTDSFKGFLSASLSEIEKDPELIDAAKRGGVRTFLYAAKSSATASDTFKESAKQLYEASINAEDGFQRLAPSLLEVAKVAEMVKDSTKKALDFQNINAEIRKLERLKSSRTRNQDFLNESVLGARSTNLANYESRYGRTNNFYAYQRDSGLKDANYQFESSKNKILDELSSKMVKISELAKGDSKNSLQIVKADLLSGKADPTDVLNRTAKILEESENTNTETYSEILDMKSILKINSDNNERIIKVLNDQYKEQIKLNSLQKFDALISAIKGSNPLSTVQNFKEFRSLTQDFFNSDPKKAKEEAYSISSAIRKRDYESFASIFGSKGSQAERILELNKNDPYNNLISTSQRAKLEESLTVSKKTQELAYLANEAKSGTRNSTQSSSIAKAIDSIVMETMLKGLSTDSYGSAKNKINALSKGLNISDKKSLDPLFGYLDANAKTFGKIPTRKSDFLEGSTISDAQAGKINPEIPKIVDIFGNKMPKAVDKLKESIQSLFDAAANSAARVPLMQQITLEQEKLSALEKQKINPSQIEVPEYGQSTVQALASTKAPALTKIIEGVTSRNGDYVRNEAVSKYNKSFDNVADLAEKFLYNKEQDPQFLIKNLKKEREYLSGTDTGDAKSLIIKIDQAVDFMSKYYQFQKENSEASSKKTEVDNSIKETQDRIKSLQDELNKLKDSGNKNDVSFNIPVNVNIDGAFDTAGLSEEIKKTVREFIRKQSAFPGLDGPKTSVNV